MKCSEICSEVFGLVVRCIGLLLSFIGLSQLYRAPIMVLQGAFDNALVSLVSAVAVLLLGVWFLRGAPWLMSFSYPSEDKEKT
jgi:hypothetical protein